MAAATTRSRVRVVRRSMLETLLDILTPYGLGSAVQCVLTPYGRQHTSRRRAHDDRPIRRPGAGRAQASSLAPAPLVRPRRVDRPPSDLPADRRPSRAVRTEARRVLLPPASSGPRG